MVVINDLCYVVLILSLWNQKYKGAHITEITREPSMKFVGIKLTTDK